MSNCDEDRSVYNGHFEVDILIDAPVAKVWNVFLDAGSWITSHEIEQASGTPGTTGSITRVSWKVAKDLGMPKAHHHYCKIVKLVPKKQYVLKTYSEKGGSYGMDIAAFDDTRFVEIDGRTMVTFNIFAEIKAELVAKDPGAMNLDGSREGMSKNLANLKLLVESR